MSEEKYTLHFSVSDFSILLFSCIYDPKTYGAVDYRLLIKDNIGLAYLTSKGMEEAAEVGAKLLDDEFFAHIMKDSEQLSKDLKAYKVPKLDENNIKQSWEDYLVLMNEFCRLYRYFEMPFQQRLEEIVLEHLSENELVTLLSKHHEDSINMDTISEAAGSALKKLLAMGKMKLEIHLSAEPLVTTELETFVKYIAEMYELSEEAVSAFTTEEVSKAIEGQIPDLETVKERLKGVALVKKEGAWYYESGKDYEEWEHRIKSTQDMKIQGNVAYPGKIQGKVMKHMSWTGTSHIDEGDILVTGMTNPQMIPYIEKAAAIVTDEGGITCHAAIISREMKKPCIVGTKNATQLLEDGDYIEVDAEKGEVNILKKAKMDSGPL